MGRLIDADELEEKLRKHQRGIMALAIALSLVDEAPTAYDVEAVVKDIQEIGTRFCVSVHCNDECECCDHGSMMKAIIDIVRNGGVK